MKSSPPGDATAAAYSIGEIAAYFDLAPHVLRHWESVGLLAPATRVGGRRRYTRAHFARVAMILRSKEIGLSLAQIRELLDACDGRGRRRILQSQLDALDEQIARIQTSKQLITHVLTCRHEDFTECPRFQQEIVAAVTGAHRAENQLRGCHRGR
ncbi:MULTISPECIES: MerR family transcriptional regulator [Nocardia]|uniref:helix-turn-helix domain-containing protein n=1 Tax=Nocardia TaxID=1817 RepID=UPI001893F1E8|nr:MULTISPECIES: MerR family transcriptional regulator [Nocardia]MBF6349514.1 MerR family transcriptional regulator [Nocardia flavorosea]